MPLIRRIVEGLLRFDLRRSFRRVCWVGEWPPALPDGPVIAYANHHHFYDGHLAWLLFTDRLDRPSTLWMAEWDRFPFFAAVGAQPFPPRDPGRRAATIRRTAHRFQRHPRTVLVYYPEGALHSPDAGIRPFEMSDSQRLAALYPDATWWPYAVHVTWWDEAAPTALVTGGPGHEADGQERARLQHLWNDLHVPDPAPLHVLFTGPLSPEERWSFSFASSFFERYL